MADESSGGRDSKAVVVMYDSEDEQVDQLGESMEDYGGGFLDLDSESEAEAEAEAEGEAAEARERRDNLEALSSTTTTSSSSSSKSERQETSRDGREYDMYWAMTAEQESLWDTRLLYSSKLSMEDLLWTDWFSGKPDELELQEAMQSEKSGKLGGLEALIQAGRSGMTSRILHRTSGGKERQCVGTNLSKVGSVAVSLWCDPERTSRDMIDTFGRGRSNPTSLFAEKGEGAQQNAPKEYVLNHACALGLALCLSTTKPVLFSDLKESIYETLGEKNVTGNVKEAIEKLENSDILYEGVFGIPLPRILFHEPKHSNPIELESNSKSKVWQVPALRKVQEVSATLSRTLRKQFIRCQQEYVKVGTDFVFDFREAADEFTGESSLNSPVVPLYENPFQLDTFGAFDPSAASEDAAPGEGLVDLIVVSPPDRYGKRSNFQMGTFGMNGTGKTLLNTCIFDIREESLASNKNYPLLGLSYVANGFSGLSWEQQLPRWRRVLRTSGKRLKRKLNSIGREFIGRNVMGPSRVDESVENIDALEIIDGEACTRMNYMETSFECYDLRAGNPLPMLLHSVHTRGLAMKKRQQRQCIYQLK